MPPSEEDFDRLNDLRQGQKIAPEYTGHVAEDGSLGLAGPTWHPVRGHLTGPGNAWPPADAAAGEAWVQWVCGAWGIRYRTEAEYQAEQDARDRAWARRMRQEAIETLEDLAASLPKDVASEDWVRALGRVREAAEDLYNCDAEDVFEG